MDILAAVNWEDVILVGSALGIFSGSKYMHGKIAKPRSNGGFNKALCDERHKSIDDRHHEIRDNFKTVFDKLDKITDHLLK